MIRQTLCALLCLFFVTSFALETKYVPTFMWSGKKEYLNTKNAQESKCAVKNIKDQLLYGKFGQSTPKYIVGFFQEEFESKDFRSAALAFKKEINGGSFSNLMKTVQETSESSIVYPRCSMENYERFDDLISRISVTVVTDKVTENLKKFKTISISKFKEFLQNGKLETKYYFVFFGESKENLAENDKIMKEITDLLSQASQGDYVAFYTTNSLSAPSLDQVSIARQILTVQQTTNTSTSNDTWWADEPMFVDEQVLAGVISMSIWIGILLWGFCWLNCVWLAPHIDNPFEDVAAKMAKKH